MGREKEGTICSCVTQVRTVPLIAGKKKWYSTRNQVDEEILCGCATFKSLFIYLLFIFYVACQNLTLTAGLKNTMI